MVAQISKASSGLVLDSGLEAAMVLLPELAV